MGPRPTPYQSDEDLCALIRTGDTTALYILVKRYKTKLCSFLLWRFPSKANDAVEGKDVVQNLYIRMMLRVRQGEDVIEDYRAAYKILKLGVYHQMLDQLKKDRGIEKRIRENENGRALINGDQIDQHSIVEPGDTMDAENPLPFQNPELLLAYEAALPTMTPKERAAMEIELLELDLTSREKGEMINSSESSFNVHTFRARQKIIKAFWRRRGGQSHELTPTTN